MFQKAWCFHWYLCSLEAPLGGSKHTEAQHVIATRSEEGWGDLSLEPALPKRRSGGAQSDEYHHGEGASEAKLGMGLWVGGKQPRKCLEGVGGWPCGRVASLCARYQSSLPPGGPWGSCTWELNRGGLPNGLQWLLDLTSGDRVGGENSGGLGRT